MRVLVTGGAGFIGSNMVDELVRKHIRVRVLDNLAVGRLENLAESSSSGLVEFLKGDVTIKADVEKAVKGVDAVFHGAALVSIPQSLREPALVQKVNAEGTINLLEACRRFDVKRFVYASSCSVYGQAKVPIHEDSPLKPLSPYAASKLSAELYCEVYWRVYGLRTTSLRYFNVYGPRQTGSQYSGVISIFAKRILKNKSPVIYGDGKQTRDFIYVTDVVEANMLALAKRKVEGEAFNIASGKSTSINRLAKTMLRLTGKQNLEPTHTNARPGDILHSQADISKASMRLGYRARTTLEEGLRCTLDWHKARMRNPDAVSIGSKMPDRIRTPKKR